jgi:hypothetical protein
MDEDKGWFAQMRGFFTRIDGVVFFLLLVFAFQVGLLVNLEGPAGYPLIVALACTLSGALMGFLFAVPKRIRSQAPGVPASGQAQPNSGSTSSEQVIAQANYEANSSLEEISDWLTKIIVGVGLVEAQEIARQLTAAGGAVGTGIFNLPATSPASQVAGVATILAFAVLGFLMSFLWFRQNLMIAWEHSHVVAKPAPIHGLHNAPPGNVQSMTLAAAPAGMPPEPSLSDADSAMLRTLRTAAGDDSPLSKLALEKYSELRTRAKFEDDWGRDMFGGASLRKRPFRALSATVRPVESSEYFEVTIKLTSRPPAKGKAVFFLHNTFAEPMRIVSVDSHGVATLRIYAWGAFTVGALADDGETELELNLAKLSDAPPAFRSR